MDRTTRYVEPPTPPSYTLLILDYTFARPTYVHIRCIQDKNVLVRSQALVHNVASFDNLQGGWCSHRLRIIRSTFAFPPAVAISIGVPLTPLWALLKPLLGVKYYAYAITFIV
ncbi:hypothetical protein M0804_009095 [Polistes exclamans]|nr:hypothetical protein M0804_009095 [Polistes exclamans]